MFLFFQEVKKCFRSLLIHRLRTLLSTLGVLFGVTAVIAMLSIGEGAKQETLEQIEQLGMNSIIVRQPQASDEQDKSLSKRSKGLSEDDFIAIQANIPNLKHTVPLKILEATLTGTSASISPEILAINRSYGEHKHLKLSEGRFICDHDNQQKNLVCVLGQEIAKSIGKEGHVGSTIRIDNTPYEVVGVLQSTHWKASRNRSITTRNLDKTLFVPLGTESILPRNPKKQFLSEIILQVSHPQHLSNTATLSKLILKQLHDGHEDFQIVIPKELLDQAYKTQHTFNLVLGSIAAISLLVGGIGIMNIMLATVSERTREIGIRRAVGANKRHIMTQFLSETLVLTLTGAFLGILLGIFCSFLISVMAGWKTIVTPWSVILSLFMASAVGLCSGLYPAYQAATMNPIKALRHD